ncbi:RNA-binding protein 25 isoform X2 [Halyomorpha halys]|uniref:RNA-binding protein 25 isoform X2 n=1 Tax=Halyomorpha halys TaxID=286706 RepID=UPI0006D4E57A|nr:RNA-binding protein 25 isoform X2 [Halyomorpha halys]
MCFLSGGDSLFRIININSSVYLKEMSTDPSLVPPGTLPTTFIPTTSAGNVGYMVMSYPGRPPMVPGIPMPPGMGMPYMQIGAPPPLMPGVPMPMGPMMGGPPLAPMVPRAYRPTPVTTSAPPRPKAAPPVRYLPPQPDGPSVTVFVGNITERAPDQMIRFILSACGHVTSWKRVQAFGFCEFGNPDAGLRAIRLLHDYEIAGKKLVVKVDAKTKTVLEEYKNEKRKKAGSSSPLQDESVDEDDYMDDDMKATDKAALDRIAMILSDYENEIKNYVPPQNEEAKPAPEIKLPVPTPPVKHDGAMSVDLTDANIEDDRRDLITREIGKFREIMKKQEEEKEVERKKREEKERERRSDRSPASSISRNRSPIHDRSPASPAETVRHRSHKASRHRTKSRERDRERERDKERERDRDSERPRERERDKERDSKSERDLLREKEEEEEAKERKKQERKAREKEAAYQERLRAWESRERHKVKESLKEKEKKRLKEEEREKEAKRLKEFLEDYDDERDDIKYYKGRELARRLEEREKEMEIDAKDRQKEKEELAELKAKIFAGNSDDPNAEFAKAMKAREELYKPKIIVNMTEERKIPPVEKEKERERIEEDVQKRRNSPEDDDDDRSGGASPAHPSPISNGSSPGIPPETIKPVPHPKGHSSPSDRKKKKLDVKEVFNNDEDEETITTNKKRKLVPLDYSEEKKKGNGKESSGKDKESIQEMVQVQQNNNKEDKKEEHAKSQEEKRKHIKSLIDRIPTDKAALFSYILDWAAVDNQLMERRIRPWINKKIIEYIGEPEPTLVDFICSKVLAGSAPQGILDDVQMVLDEEAEVFVVKMWRLLIYEIEAKKLGLVK